MNDARGTGDPIRDYLAAQEARRRAREHVGQAAPDSPRTASPVVWIVLGAALVGLGALVVRRASGGAGSRRDPAGAAPIRCTPIATGPNGIVYQCPPSSAARDRALGAHPQHLRSLHDPYSLEAYACDCEAVMMRSRGTLPALPPAQAEPPDAFRMLLDTEMRTRKGGRDPRDDDADDYYDAVGAMHPYEEAAYNRRTRKKDDDFGDW